MSELGTKLRDARIEKGYTLNTLQQMTKIQKKYLQAIEEGNYDEMPGTFYVRAFVKQYADMVGLDGDELLNQYGEELITITQDTNQENSQDNVAIPSRVERHEAKEKSNMDVILSYLPLVLLIAIIIAIMVALITAINSINNVEEPQTEVATQTPSIVSVVEPESIEIQESEPEDVAEEPEESEPAEPVLGENDILVGSEVLTLISGPGEVTTYQLNAPFADYEFEVEGNSFVWVGVFEDGGIVEDTTVNDGDTLEVSASPGIQEIRISLGYPEGADLTVNGEQVEAQGTVSPETIVFVAGDDIEEDTEETTETEATDETIELDMPAEDEVDETNETGFQGPAVLDPANQNDGAE